MKQLYIEKDIELPEDLKVTIKGSLVTIEGSKGSLTKDFENANVELKKLKNKINVRAFYINKKKKGSLNAP